MKKRLLILFCCLFLTGCAAVSPLAEKETVALDTVVKIALYDSDDTALVEGCLEQIRQLEQQLSRTVEGSDIQRLNTALGQPVTVSQDTAELLSTALHYSQLTAGAFDVTVAPVVDVWDFKSGNAAPPSQERITAALQTVGYSGLTVTGDKAQLAQPNAAVDLGGIAKGYVADRCAAYLREQGVGSALIDLGGNIYALGSRDGKDWRVGIRDPEQEGALAAVVMVQDCSVVTSGTYERGFDHDGVRYHHILDPATGRPVQNGLASVTVVSENSAQGDALATACFVLGPENGLALAESLPGVEALFIAEDGTLTATSGLHYETK